MRTQFDFNAYGSPEDGKFYVDGQEYFLGEDYRSEKRYREYKNAGFTLLCVEKRNTYNGEEFQTSSLKKCMDEAYKAGINKIILADRRINSLIETRELIGKGCKFATQAELESYLDECTAVYRDYPGFYGFQLYDEPHWWMLKSYGLVVKALKKLIPGVYLQCNLLNMVGPDRTAENEPDTFKAYEKYLNSFLDETQLDYLMYDDYPFRREYIICGLTLRNYQMAAEICKKRGKEFRTVLQSFGWITEQQLLMRHVTEQDMRWQSNMALGVGCREFSFYTYFPCAYMRYKGGVGGDGLDGWAFINQDGTRSKLYYAGKKIMSELKAFAPVALKYSYDGNYLFFSKGTTYKDYEQTEYALVNEGCPIGVKLNGGVAFVTEHKNGEDSLFMVENIGNVRDELFYGIAAQKLEVNVGENYKEIRFYSHGKRVNKKVVNGKVKFALRVGDALFIEIIK